MDTPGYIAYFDVQAILRRSFLHPGGRLATKKLLSYIPLSDRPCVMLELGCGLGYTAQLLLEGFPCRYIGLDASSRMLQHARDLLANYHGRVSLLECDLKMNTIPLSSASIDIIIAESVFAILDPPAVFQECYRVLKEGGILAWNDRIWGDQITHEQSSALNWLSVQLDGCQAAPQELRTVADWQGFAARLGFDLIIKERLEKVLQPSASASSGEEGIVAKLVQGLLYPKLFKVLRNDRKIARAYAETWQKMESYLFVARKIIA